MEVAAENSPHAIILPVINENNSLELNALSVLNYYVTD